MSNYTTADFSPIFGPQEQPVHVGWYCSTWHMLDDIHKRYAQPDANLDWWWWTGEQWLTYPDGEPAINQQRFWFGLKEKP